MIHDKFFCALFEINPLGMRIEKNKMTINP